MLTYDEVIKNEAIKIYIIRADESLGALGYTKHSFDHVMHVAQMAGYITHATFFGILGGSSIVTPQRTVQMYR